MWAATSLSAEALPPSLAPVLEQDKNLLLLPKPCPQDLLKLGTKPSVFLRRMRFDLYQASSAVPG